MNDYKDVTQEEFNNNQLVDKINWLCSVNIIDAIPSNKRTQDLKKILKRERKKYLDNIFILKQIDFIINFNNMKEVY